MARLHLSGILQSLVRAGFSAAKVALVCSGLGGLASAGTTMHHRFDQAFISILESIVSSLLCIGASIVAALGRLDFGGRPASA